MNIEELNNERKRLKMSVTDLANKANLPKGTVEKVLFGIVKHPRIDTMQAIENALGLNQQPQWTKEEKALGVGRHKTNLSEDEWKWLELRNSIIETHGEKYLDTVITMLIAITKQ